MTIDFDCGFGDDPKHDNNQTLTDDGFLNLGGQCVYVGRTPQPARTVRVAAPTPRQSHPEDDWIDLGTQSFYVGKN